MTMNIEIKKLEGQDVSHFEALVNVFEEVFGMDNFLMPDRSYLQSLLENEHFMVYAAFFGEQVVGGLTAHILPSYYFQSSEVYIYDLAIDAPFQRKGTGRKLVDALKQDCRAMGLREVFVHAERADEHALGFYHATGGDSEDVVHFRYPLL